MQLVVCSYDILCRHFWKFVELQDHTQVNLFSNLCNWKEEGWKNQGFNVIQTRDLRDTGHAAMQISVS